MQAVPPSGRRPPGEVHGPFTADGDVVVLEVSYPSQSIRRDGRAF